MPPPHNHNAILPTNHLRHDPWTTSSTGHQVADSAHGTAYRAMRQEKLKRQFGEGRGDCTVLTGAGGKAERGVWVEEKDGSANGRGTGQRDIRGMFGVGKSATSTSASGSKSPKDGKVEADSGPWAITNTNTNTNTVNTSISNDNTHLQDRATIPAAIAPLHPGEYPQLFTTLTVYINAASHPCVSDHKLKHLLTLHGATVSLSLSRRVTHVIVGRPNARPGSGAGGGLAGEKLQREIARGGCRGWKVVFVEW